MAKTVNVIRCENGHYYNSDNYECCPECAKGKEPNTKSKKIEIVSDVQQKSSKESKTISLWKSIMGGSSNVSKVETKTERKTMTEKKIEIEPEAEKREEIKAEPKSKSVIENKIQKEISLEPEEDSLETIIDNADVDQDDIKTISVYGNVSIATGWLVVVEGPDLGVDYRIGDGKNRLGRNPNMDISIKSDKSISRDTHTVLMYDPEGLEFYILPNEGKGTAYLNGKIILTPEKLKKCDLIKVGNTVLYFIPLCGEEFDWKNYL